MNKLTKAILIIIAVAAYCTVSTMEYNDQVMMERLK